MKFFAEDFAWADRGEVGRFHVINGSGYFCDLIVMVTSQSGRVESLSACFCSVRTIERRRDRNGNTRSK
jgi:hypothetical protein